MECSKGLMFFGFSNLSSTIVVVLPVSSNANALQEFIDAGTLINPVNPLLKMDNIISVGVSSVSNCSWNWSGSFMVVTFNSCCFSYCSLLILFSVGICKLA